MCFYSILNQVTHTHKDKTNKNKWKNTARLFLFRSFYSTMAMWTKGEFATQNQTPFELNTLTLVIACAAILAQRLAIHRCWSAVVAVSSCIVDESKWIMVEWSTKQRHAYQICTIHTATTFKLKRLLFCSSRWGHCHWNWSAHTKHISTSYSHTYRDREIVFQRMDCKSSFPSSAAPAASFCFFT